MKHSISFQGVKGGVGTSTVVALTACTLETLNSDAGSPILIIERGTDCATLLGRPVLSLEAQLGPWENISTRILIASNINTSDQLVRAIDALDSLEFDGDGTPPVILIDSGRDYWEGAALNVTVAGNDFLSLKAGLALDGAERPTHIAVVLEASRPLGKKECADILGGDIIAVLPRCTEIARASDAGVLDIKTPKQASSALKDLAQLILDTTRKARAPKAHVPEY
jgi:hypothetical protein